jgi:hypothetical protein
MAIAFRSNVPSTNDDNPSREGYLKGTSLEEFTSDRAEHCPH